MWRQKHYKDLYVSVGRQGKSEHLEYERMVSEEGTRKAQVVFITEVPLRQLEVSVTRSLVCRRNLTTVIELYRTHAWKQGRDKRGTEEEYAAGKGSCKNHCHTVLPKARIASSMSASMAESLGYLVYVLEQPSIGQQGRKPAGIPHASFPPRQEERPGCRKEGGAAAPLVWRKQRC